MNKADKNMLKTIQHTVLQSSSFHIAAEPQNKVKSISLQRDFHRHAYFSSNTQHCNSSPTQIRQCGVKRSSGMRWQVESHLKPIGQRGGRAPRSWDILWKFIHSTAYYFSFISLFRKLVATSQWHLQVPAHMEYNFTIYTQNPQWLY